MKQTGMQPFSRFLVLWSGSFIAAVGHGLSSFGLGIYVYERTGLASASTLIMLLGFLPMLLLTPLAGVLADRYDRRLLMLLGDGVSALGILYILFAMKGEGAALWQVGAGVLFSSIFSSLVEPSFRATVSDMLSPEDFSRASGLTQLTNSAQYLISPLLAGVLMKVGGMRLLLLLDIGTLLPTALAILFVRRGLPRKEQVEKQRFLRDMGEGLRALRVHRGIFALALLGTAISFFLGVVQSLFTPFILSFADRAVLSVSTTVAATGMLVSSLWLGIRRAKGSRSKTLFLALGVAGLFMAAMAVSHGITLVTMMAFCFFACLPFANMSLDYLVRTNIHKQLEGRIWGMIGLISQLGFVAAFAVAGPLADFVLKPLLQKGVPVFLSINRLLGGGVGAGMRLLIVISGLCMSLTALFVHNNQDIRALDTMPEMEVEHAV